MKSIEFRKKSKTQGIAARTGAARLDVSYITLQQETRSLSCDSSHAAPDIARPSSCLTLGITQSIARCTLQTKLRGQVTVLPLFNLKTPQHSLLTPPHNIKHNTRPKPLNKHIAIRISLSLPQPNPYSLISLNTLSESTRN